LIQEEIKKILNSGDACYHSVQNLLSSRLLSTNTKIRTYNTVIFPVELYGCERNEAVSNKVLGKVCGPNRNGVTGGWRKLHNEELRDLYTSPSIIRIIKWRRLRLVGHIARMGEKRTAYRLLVRKPEGNRPLGRPRCRWIYNIKMDRVEVGLGGVDWIGLVQDKIKWREGSCECSNEPSVSIKCWESVQWLHNWWPLQLQK
jgi:hypothetical protein